MIQDPAATPPPSADAPERADEVLEAEDVLGAATPETADPGVVGETAEGGVEALEAQLAEARARLAEERDRFLRKAAELENTKRRLNKQMEETKKFASEEVAKELVPVLDDLELALEHAKEGDQPPVETFLEGILLVRRKFAAVLEHYGVVGFESVGKPFDPKVHEAISQMESAEVPDGHVLSEYLKGYMIHDRLLRPALVIVARNSSGEGPEA